MKGDLHFEQAILATPTNLAGIFVDGNDQYEKERDVEILFKNYVYTQ